MQPTIDLRTAEITMNRVLNQMAQLTGFDKRVFVVKEAGAILRTTAGRIGLPKNPTIDARTRVKTLAKMGLTGSQKWGSSDITINSGERGPEGRVWIRTKNDKWQLAHTEGKLVGKRNNLHFKSRAWSNITSAVAAYRKDVRKQIPMSRQSAGLARLSIIQSADDLNIKLETVPGGGISPAAIARARRAVPSDGKPRKLGSGISIDTPSETSVIIVNTLKYGHAAGIDRVLANSIQGRVKYFHENLSRGVFKSFEAIAKRYPGLATPLPK